MDTPLLSVIVAVVSDTIERPNAAHLEPCLEALTAQTGAPAMEIVVPYHPSTAGMDRVRGRFPSVRFIPAGDLKTYTGRTGNREHHDELRARGLAAARGSILALIEDHGAAAPDWAARLVEAHAGPFAAIGGAIENGIDAPLNWAVYYCDFLRYQNPLPEGDAALVSDANVSYKREDLEAVRPVWREIFHEASVTEALRGAGKRLGMAPRAIVDQRRLGLRMGMALRERFIWGRSYAATRARLADTPRRIFWAVFTPALPFLMLLRMTSMARQKRRTWAAFVKAFPYTAALSVAWSCGEFLGYVSGRAQSGGAPAAEAIARGTRTGA